MPMGTNAGPESRIEVEPPYFEESGIENGFGACGESCDRGSFIIVMSHPESSPILKFEGN